MAVQTLTFEVITKQEADLLEAGVQKSSWTLESDARIKTESNELGIGPVVYSGRTEDPLTDEYNKDGVVRDALFLFIDETDCVKSLVSNMDPTDLTDTMADFMSNHGGSVTAMQALRPTV